MGRYLGSARNGVWGASGDVDLTYNEAVLSRGRGPSISTFSALAQYSVSRRILAVCSKKR